MTIAFEPVNAGTVSRTVSGASASVAAPALAGAVRAQLLLTGATAVAFVKLGTAAAVATAADTPVVNNVPVIIDLPAFIAGGVPYVGAIGTDGTLYITAVK